MIVCASCGQENPEGFRFCGNCAAPLAAAPARRDIRKVVTVVFCDLTGSTEVGDRTDPETLRQTMRGYYEQMRTILERHGGTVEKFVGDAVMAVFGVPVAHEDDALRAVRAAWEMRDAVPALGLRARIGVNTGEVVAGEGDTLVTGDAVNVAARLEQHASPGSVLIGADTRRLVRGAVEAEAFELEVKGKPAPLVAYRLLAVDPDAPAFLRRLDTPLVGRDRELALLRQAYERAVSDRACALFTLLGAAGVGKSRVVEELLTELPAARVLRGRCLHYGEGITFWPVVEVLKQLGPRADATVELVVAGAGSPNELFWAMRAQLEDVARERPLVVVFDDIQWGEPTFLDLLDHVSDLSRDAPILLLCLARPELLDDRPGWGGGKLNATTVLLEPLSEEESGRLIDLLGDGFDAGMRSRILDAAAGNPLYVEEMLALAREGGDVAVPSTIHALLQARLDRLAPDERTVIERAAVEGSVFHRGAVAVLAPDTDVEPQLVGLVRKELIRPDRATLPGDDAFRFRHLLVRDAAYDALPKETRAALHELFAAWLAEHGRTLVELDELLGYHLEQSARYRRELGRADSALERRAGERLAAAGSKAAGRGDVPAADNLLSRALDLLPPADPARVRILRELATALVGAGSFEHASRLIDELEASADRATKMYGRIARLELRWNTDPVGAGPEMRRAAEEAIGLFTAVGDEAGIARAWLLLFSTHWKASQARSAVAALEQALDHAARAGDRASINRAWAYMGGPLTHGPFDPRTVRERLAEVRKVADGPLVDSFTWMVESALARFAGDFDKAKALHEQADEILAELGISMIRWVLRQVAAQRLVAEGRADEAVRLYREIYDALGELGEVGFRSTVATMMAEPLYESGRLEEADRLAREGEEMGGSEDIVNFAYGRSVRARVLADRGRTAEAEAEAREALRYALETDFPLVHAKAHLALAHVLGVTGRTSEARSHVEQAIAAHESHGDVVLAARASELLVEL